MDHFDTLFQERVGASLFPCPLSGLVHLFRKSGWIFSQESRSAVRSFLQESRSAVSQESRRAGGQDLFARRGDAIRSTTLPARMCMWGSGRSVWHNADWVQRRTSRARGGHVRYSSRWSPPVMSLEGSPSRVRVAGGIASPGGSFRKRAGASFRGLALRDPLSLRPQQQNPKLTTSR